MRLAFIMALSLILGPIASRPGSAAADVSTPARLAPPPADRFVVLAAGMSQDDKDKSADDGEKLFGFLDPEMARLLFAGIAGAIVTILASAVYRRYDKNASRAKITLDFYSQFNSLEFYTNIRAKAYSFFLRHLLRDEELRSAIGYSNFPPHYTMPEEFGTGSSHASKMLSPSWTDQPVFDLAHRDSAIPKDTSTSMLMDFFHNLVECANKRISDERLTRELFNQQWFLYRDYYLYLAREIIITPEFQSATGIVYPGYEQAKAILQSQGIDEVLIVKQIKEVVFFFHAPKTGRWSWKSEPLDVDALFAAEIKRAADEIDQRVEAYRREAYERPERLSDCLVSLVSPNRLAEDSKCVTLKDEGCENLCPLGDSPQESSGVRETNVSLIGPG